ncbi:MAG TPA: hypothetical protein VKB68_09285 [Stellaceae bacterium]|nr:hypothetical protein [Stellaceae bacterium]
MTSTAAPQDSGTRRAAGSVGRLVWSGALVVAAALIGCLVIFGNASFLGFAIHADSLHLALTVWDYSTHDYARDGFSMSREPSVVPDLLVYGSIQLATGSWRLASLAYGILSLLGLAVAVGGVVREITRCRWRTAMQAFLLLTLPVLMLELPITAASEHMQIFLPNNHGGPFILALAALCLARDWLQRPGNGKLTLLGVLVAAGVLSDPLFVISCVGPICVALAYSLLRRRIALRTAVPLVACLATGGIAARALDVFLVRDELFDIDWAAVPGHVRAFVAGIGELAAAAPLTALLAFGLPTAVFLCYPLISRARDREPRTRDAVEYWWILSGSSIAASLAATPLVYDGPWHFRYMMPLVWWPITWSTALVVRASGPARSSAISAGLAGVAVVLGFAYFSPGLRAPALLALHHPLEACLLEAQRTAGLKAGLGDYWYSRYIEASSDWRLQIDQIEPDGAGMWWSNDRFWYTHDIHDATREPEYNYILMPRLNEEAIRRHYGPPDRTLECGSSALGVYGDPSIWRPAPCADCGGTAIWIYDDPSAIRRALERGSPALYATFLESDDGGGRICVPADRFYSATHERRAWILAPLEGALEARAETPDPGRPRTWGPYFGLPSGRWMIALDYSLASDAPGRDRWDVAADAGRTTLYEAVLAPTDGVVRTVRTEIDLKKPARSMEIHTFLGGTGAIAIHSAEIARTGTTGAEDCAR